MNRKATDTDPWLFIKFYDVKDFLTSDSQTSSAITKIAITNLPHCLQNHNARHIQFTLFIDFLLLRGISMAIKEIYVVHIWTCSKVFACFSLFCVFLGRMKQASKQVHVPSWSLSQLTARNAGKLCVTISGFSWMFGLNYQTISLIATSPAYFRGFSVVGDFFMPGNTSNQDTIMNFFINWKEFS